MSETEILKSQTLEHLGLVAGMFDELGIGDLVDELVPQDLCQRNVSVGQALKAMVLNGLGFANRRLYLMPEFFRNKPTERLVGAGISPEHLNDDALGKALDTLYAFGLTELYRLIAREAAERLGLGEAGGVAMVGHLDTTSFHVDGRYNSEGDDDSGENAGGVIHVSKGYSRDHREDLNQVVLELITESRANLPMMMRPLSGNASDKTSFKDAIERHIGQLRADDGGGPSMVVIDSAGFIRECLMACQRQGLGWVMSVPSTVGEARRRLEEVVDPEELRPLAEGYRYSASLTTYAGVEQRWLVIYSESARGRAAKQVDKRLIKQGEQERKAFDELCREAFHCPEDALRALAAFRGTLRVLEVHGADVIERRHYQSAGKPAADAVPESINHHIDGALAAPIAVRERRLIRRSCFILATNELDEGVLTDPEVLWAYKGQSSKVERGFRFLKDPMFLASTLYLKRVERVMALLMVMTVCLMVYAALEYRIRQTLAEHNESVPDQKGKPTVRPTAKWVFELFMDVHLLTIITTEKPTRALVLNLREELKRLLELMGPSYMELYS